MAAIVALSAASPARAADHDIQLLSSQQLDPRLTELTLSTPALRAPTHVRVLLPAGYDGSQYRYPVVCLLHGAFADYRAWTDAGDAEAITAGKPLIVVMIAARDGRAIAGLSMGGFGALSYAGRHPDLSIGRAASPARSM